MSLAWARGRLGSLVFFADDRPPCVATHLAHSALRACLDARAVDQLPVILLVHNDRYIGILAFLLTNLRLTFTRCTASQRVDIKEQKCKK